MKRGFVFAVLCLAATSMFAQLPPGKWWRRPQVVQTLALSVEQQDKLDAIFRGAANDLIDTKAELDKSTVALRGELDRPQLDRAAIRAIAQRINQARSRKFERELMMLADMRAVLSEEQWKQMRHQLDEFREHEQDKPRPKMRR
jgi:Spy/CpxP family protein refolding chaperone